MKNVLVGFCQFDSNLESPEMREPQVRISFHEIGLWAYFGEHFLDED